MRDGKPCILCVDDQYVEELDEVIRRNYGEAIEILTAVDVATARRLLDEHADEIDLIVLDIFMPDDSPEGLDLGREVGDRIPVIFISGHPGSEFADRVEGLAPLAFHQKPVDASRLVEQIRAGIGLRHAKSEWPTVKSREPPPAYFSSVFLENVRCFGPRQTLNLADDAGRPFRWTLIVGDNGVGKTTLLQCIAGLAAAVSPSQPGTEGGRVVPVAATRLGCFSNWLPYRHKGQFPPQIGTSVCHGATLTVPEGAKREESLGLTVSRQARDVQDAAYDRVGGLLCYGYGSTRRMRGPSLSPHIDAYPCAGLFSDECSLMNAEEWLLQADYRASQPPSIVRDRTRMHRDRIRELLIQILPGVRNINIDRLRPAVEMHTPYGWASMSDMSLGYRCLVAWIVDLASRLFQRYSESTDPLAEPAIVLIDEIDLHLHPLWQRTLMRDLSERFQNTQFIATSHSPLVLQSSRESNIVLLERVRDTEHVAIRQDVPAVYGWRADQILTSDFFGFDTARPPDLAPLLAEREQILSKGSLSDEDEQRLENIKAELGRLPLGETPNDIEAMDVIRQVAARIKEGKADPL